MRHPRVSTVLGVIAAVLAACSLGPAVPGGVAPTLTALRDAGLRCDTGRPDNIPSGLVQWRCEGLSQDVPVVVLLDGDAKGVFDVSVQVPGSTDRRTAVAVLARAVSAIGPMQPIVDESAAWITTWPGGRAATTIESASLVVEGDQRWITLTVFPGPRHAVGDPGPS